MDKDNIPEDFLDRMILEGAELDERIRKAQKFLEKRDMYEKDPLAYDLLQAQVTAMATYSNILLIRVNRERANRNLPTLAQF